MIQSVTDARSNKNDQIKHAVETIGRSKDRLKVFKAIYKGPSFFLIERLDDHFDFKPPFEPYRQGTVT